ncbi:membrane protein [Xenorhabdus khoisanae]|uniref:Membrane protein n=1 Tax=Xenorhabdus khoisanae TaxID=880157 RepID=A0A0J5IPL5_9GAMM|nr:hypothetical protein [Xenorhabdus khoisanae]KMJ45160.1 membrane protein [Xenorhabdus khoisanae]
MPPLLIEEHEKNLVWPDNLDDPEQAYVHLNDIIDDIGDAHTVILEDSNGMVRLYLRHVRSDQVSANILLEFKLSAPESFPNRIPQVSSVYVGRDYRGVKLAPHIYRCIIDHYGVVVSDTYQTAAGMFIWLFIAEDDSVLLNIMQVNGNHLDYRLSNGKPEVYKGEIDTLEQAGSTIWGRPDAVVSGIDLERLGFKPTHQNMEHIILAAR